MQEEQVIKLGEKPITEAIKVFSREELLERIELLCTKINLNLDRVEELIRSTLQKLDNDRELINSSKRQIDRLNEVQSIQERLLGTKDESLDKEFLGRIMDFEKLVDDLENAYSDSLLKDSQSFQEFYDCLMNNAESK